MGFEKGNKFGKGRPPGALNKIPSRDKLNELLDRICDDLTENYSTLSTNQKIRVLIGFASLYSNSALAELKQAIAEISEHGSVIKFEFDI